MQTLPDPPLKTNEFPLANCPKCESRVKSILNVVVVVVVLVWVLQAAGLWGGIGQYRIGR